jgi:hypothetical protein
MNIRELRDKLNNLIRNGYGDYKEGTVPSTATMKYYHGSDILIKDYILPPILTNNLREKQRVRDLDKVWCTSNFKSAKSYSKGYIYIVEPKGEIWELHNGEIMADYLKILDMVYK